MHRFRKLYPDCLLNVQTNNVAEVVDRSNFAAECYQLKVGYTIFPVLFHVFNPQMRGTGEVGGLFGVVGNATPVFLIPVQ